MELSQQQKKEFFHKGYLKISGIVPQKRINVALRAMNHSLGLGMDPRQAQTFRANSFCPELRQHPSIADLFWETSLLDLVGSAIEPGKFKLWGGGQIALRFPVMEEPGEFHPHIDGLYRTGNKVPKDTIQSFTMLAGVFLSDIPNRYWGNFTLWPGTHLAFEKYFQKNSIDCLRNGLPKIKMPKPEQVTGYAGDVILCHYLTAHTVVSNVSPYIRYAVFFRILHENHLSHAKETFTNIWLDWPGLRNERND